MKAAYTLLSALALAGCAGAPVASSEVAPSLFADAEFSSAPDPAISQDVFALSPAMRDYFERRISLQVQRHGARRGLVESLRGELRIEYDSAQTRNAAETFEARSGNCLSLVLMTAAFARELGVPVRYQAVYGHDTWTRSGDVAFHSGHINLVLGPLSRDRLPGIGSDHPLVIDFLPAERAANVSARAIPEEMVVAMYRNNRAAESVARGDLDQAYWWARAAIQANPAFTTAYNTLGVLYMRHGNLREAEVALNHALVREPDNLEVMSNLASLMTRTGRAEEAQAMRSRIALIEPVRPFYYFALGMAALQRGEFSDAIQMLERERAQRPYADDVHFALALLRLRQGQARLARRHLALAIENSTTPATRAIYSAKLDYLKSHHYVR